MKKLIFPLFTTFLFISCLKTTPKEKLNSILREFKPTEQVFKFSTDNQIEIVGEKGTRILINSNDLVFEDGDQVNDSIRLSLVELTTKEELIKANAQTISNGEWLISGGAYQIQLSSNGKKLKLRDGATYEISFPKTGKETMSIFYGERNENGDLNWGVTSAELKARRYPLIIKEDSSFMRFDKEYQIDLQVDTSIYRKPKGQFKLDELGENFPRLDTIILKKDTIYGFIQSRMIPETIPNGTLLEDDNDQYWDVANEVYEAIKLNKLGWINVDRFYPKIVDRSQVSIKIDQKLDYYNAYIISTEDNFLLNLYAVNGVMSFDAPTNMNFIIVIFGVMGDEIYGFKEPLHVSEDMMINVRMRKSDKDDIREYFKIE